MSNHNQQDADVTLIWANTCSLRDAFYGLIGMESCIPYWTPEQQAMFKPAMEVLRLRAQEVK